MKKNYQLLTDAAVSGLDGRPRLLLHSCCGPCSSYVLEYLLRYFDVTLLYYNPNIWPREEYEKRLAVQRELIARMCPQVGFLAAEWDSARFYAAVRGREAEPENGARCTECFALRIGETARLAAGHGFEWYCTTLTVSPHKDAARINDLGRAFAEKYGVKWLPSDFKKREGYKRSIELSRLYGLYRQDYCGCVFSRAGRG